MRRDLWNAMEPYGYQTNQELEIVIKKIVSKQNSDLPIIYGALNKTLNKIIS